MKRINQDNPYRVKVESIVVCPKCDFCDACHPVSKCPKIKWFDRVFKNQ